MRNPTEQVTLTAPDISCAHCVAMINKAVGRIEGVSRVEANETTKQWSITRAARRASA